MSSDRPDGRVIRAQHARKTRRAGLLLVARRLFAQRGYHSTSIDDLIESAGVARGTFYLYFESKRAIFDELLDELFATLASTVRRVDVSPLAPPPIEQVTQIVDQVFVTLDDNRELARILLREAVGIDADFDRRLSDFYGRIERLLVRALCTGMDLGIVRTCHPKVVAKCILGAVKELVYDLYVRADAPPAGVLQRGASAEQGLASEEPAQDARDGWPDSQQIVREVIAFTLHGLFAGTPS
jgi:AcrR family transcriptional regulator